MVPNVAGSSPVDRPSFPLATNSNFRYSAGLEVPLAKKKTSKNKIEPRDLRTVQGLLTLSATLALFLSLVSFTQGHYTQNILGLVGLGIGWGFHGLFGLGSYLFCLFSGWLGWRLLFHKPINHPLLKLSFAILFLISYSVLLNLIEHQYPQLASALRQMFYPYQASMKLRPHLGGAPLYFLAYDLPDYNLYRIVSDLGIALIFSTTLTVSLIFLAKINPMSLIETISNWIKQWKEEREEASKKRASTLTDGDDMRMVKLRIPNPTPANPNQQDLLAIQPEMNPKIRPSLSRKGIEEPEISVAPPPAPAPKEPEKPPTLLKKREAALAAQQVYNGDFKGYALPSPSLLSLPKKVDQNLLKKDLKRQAEVLEETLMSFGIEAKVGQINCGPTITSFEVHPSIGVKVQRIKALENDIALNMEAKSIRIIAPIPGKAAVGIEVPNPMPQEVSFKELLQAYQQGGKKYHIPVLLGKAVNGDNVMADLAKMPHCIIAGATGSGKSVCINTVVMSILLNAKPDEVKLIMVDPKKVELTPYSRLPHMLTPVITEPQEACAALNWLVKEMERRYEILKQTGARNIEGFNTRKIDKEWEASLDLSIPEKMPYIVGIVDELADLMMVSSSDIETPIARIAQMARAVGIHLILATQRPSREVITGLIKANFPTRISFKVASRVNSQIVLDEVGAETLLGNGDMLFLPPGSSHLLRAQGAFIRDEDINSVVKYICDQAPPNYIIQSFDPVTRLDDSSNNEDNSGGDSLYKDALDIVLSTGNASTTFLQRKLKIGYARAASLIDQLQAQGVVGPAEGSKPRKILAARPAQDDTEPLGEDNG